MASPATKGGTEVEMLKRWLSNVKTWLDALEGIDDPQGDYLLRLEKRVRQLEDEVQALRGTSPVPSASSTALGETNLAARPRDLTQV